MWQLGGVRLSLCYFFLLCVRPDPANPEKSQHALQRHGRPLLPQCYLVLHTHTPSVWQHTLTHVTTPRENVPLVYILYQWGDGTLKLVSKTPQLHQRTLLGAMVLVGAHPLLTEGGGDGSIPAALWDAPSGQWGGRSHCVAVTAASETASQWIAKLPEKMSKAVTSAAEKLASLKELHHYCLLSMWPEWCRHFDMSLRARVWMKWISASEGQGWHWATVHSSSRFLLGNK